MTHSELRNRIAELLAKKELGITMLQQLGTGSLMKEYLDRADAILSEVYSGIVAAETQGDRDFLTLEELRLLLDPTG